ncbi:hypothetical protein RAS1_40070 [Phycisphaerae bacterium RAS1]|nr:hypothetical protein RAS1_40070 [Phycisphaerae bacterium RAS1]
MRSFCIAVVSLTAACSLCVTPVQANDSTPPGVKSSFDAASHATGTRQPVATKRPSQGDLADKMASRPGPDSVSARQPVSRTGGGTIDPNASLSTRPEHPIDIGGGHDGGVRQGGDTCASATALAGALPITVSGTTIGYANDYDEVCPFTGSTSPDVVYSYSPTTDILVEINLCASFYDTKVYVYQGSCGSGAIACNDDGCPGSPPDAYRSRIPQLQMAFGETYYIVVDGYFGEQGDYSLTLSERIPVVIECPPNGIQENEANCGLPTDTVNGGCNSIPPVFTNISCGQTICGSGAFDGGLRDTDWFQLVLTTDTLVTQTCVAAFPVVIGIVDTGGIPDCSLATALNPFAVGGANEQIAISACLPAGTYWFFVGAQFAELVACPSSYVTSFSCETCFVPTGACCVAGQCNIISGGTCAAQGGVYFGDGSTCDPNPCLINCPDGAQIEQEPDCGLPNDTVNGGCNSAPPVFGNVACGQTICGSGAFDEGIGFRDTDWYQVVVTSDTLFTWTVQASFPVVIGLVDTGGVPDCAFATALDPFAIGAPLQPVSVSTCVGAGTYWWFVAPDFAPGIPCPSPYVATLTCEPCTAPRGACCLNGECVPNLTEGECGAGGGIYLGDGSGCTPDPCAPADNDDCSQRVLLGLPSVVAGSTLSATFDAVPDCGTSISAPGVWYSVIGDGNTITATTCGAFFGYDTKLNIYCGSCENPVCVTGNDDDCFSGANVFSSTVSWCSAMGQEYLILVQGFGGATGPFIMNLSSDGFPCSFPPSCVPPTGACCVNGNCVGTTEQPECLNMGGTWFEGNTCPGFACPIPPTNDNCPDAIAINTGQVVSGDTTLATFDAPPTCGTSISAPGVWYTIVGNGHIYDATTCVSFFGYDTKLNVYCGTCDGLFCVGGNDDDASCGIDGFLSRVTWCTEAGRTYYILVQGFGGSVGAFELLVTDTGTTCDNPVPCAPCTPPACPPGSILENEPNCGLPTDTVNGGCNSTPPVFTEIECGATVCGSGAFDSALGFRDTDWYQVTFTGETQVEWCVTAAFDSLVGIVENGGVPDCAGVSAFRVFATGLPCQTVCVTSTLPAGTWWFFVAPQFTQDWPCETPYVATLNCITSGACCLPSGDCVILSPHDCGAAGGSYLGDNTNCGGSGGNPMTYTSNPGLSIPDNVPSGVSDTMNVPDSITIGDVNIGLTIPHTWVGDLVVSVTHGATTVTIVDRPGQSGSGFGCSADNYNGIVIDDEGVVGIENACADNLTSPPNYRPNNPLSAFDGQNSAGAWVINVSDNAGADLGTLVSWSVIIDTAGVSPCARPCGLCGDSNCDGVVNILDINAFITAMSNPSKWESEYPCNYCCANDTNGDGFVNMLDVNPFILAIENAGCPQSTACNGR